MVIARNVVDLVRSLAHDAARRAPPSLDAAHQWHAEIYAGTSSPPLPAYLGAPRGSTDELADCDVMIVDDRGLIAAEGVPAADVEDELRRFERNLQQAVAVLDRVLPPGRAPVVVDELTVVVRLCAEVHGEWVRIHPYANGNGRVARTWANWVALRYGLPPFVRIKPRPGGLIYGEAARRSMVDGAHELTFQVFVDLLRAAPSRSSSSGRTQV